MDDLRTCYQSYMRLYPDDPGRLTLGRWLWCPDGAEDMPFEHSFGSSMYDPYWFTNDVPFGEVRGIVGYSSGKASPRYTGKHFCGGVLLWQQGSPLSAEGSLPVDADGVPLCCQGAPAVGGLALGGVGQVQDWTAILVWLRAEELQSYSGGDTLTTWPAGPFTAVNGTGQGVPMPTVLYDPVTNLPGGLFNARMPTLLDYSQLVWTPITVQDWTCIIVGRTLLGGQHGPSVYGVLQRNQLLAVGSAGVQARDFAGGYTLTGGSPPTLGQLHVWASTRAGDVWTLYQDGAVVATGSGTTTPLDAAGMQAHFDTSAPGQCWIPEVQIQPVAYSAAVVAAVSAALLLKYQGVDVIPPGIIVGFGGTGPVPDGWLLCDGHAVSRTDFAALFAVIGTTYGVGDGALTFNLPSAGGRALVPAGTPTQIDSISRGHVAPNTVWVVPNNLDRWVDGLAVTLSTTGTLPTPFVTGSTYYVIRIGPTQILLAVSADDCIAGNPVTYTTAGSGVHTIAAIMSSIVAGQSGGQDFELFAPNILNTLSAVPLFVDTQTAGSAVPGGGAWDGSSFLAGQDGGDQSSFPFATSGAAPVLRRVPYIGIGAAIIKT